MLDPWLSLAELANALSRVNTDHVKFYSEDEIELPTTSSPDAAAPFYWLSLPEETELRGFLPLMNLAVEEVFIKSDIPSVPIEILHTLFSLLY